MCWDVGAKRSRHYLTNTIPTPPPHFASSPRPAAKCFTFAKGSACSIAHQAQWWVMHVDGLGMGMVLMVAREHDGCCDV